MIFFNDIIIINITKKRERIFLKRILFNSFMILMKKKFSKECV